jgi:hypothetical protein
MKKNMKGKQYYNQDGVYASIDLAELPSKMDVEIMLDVGENSNGNMIQKLGKVGAEILPALNQQGAAMVVKPEAPAILATKLIEAMNLDSNDYLEDYTTDEFKQKAQQAIEQQTKAQQALQAVEQRRKEADTALAEANVGYTQAQAKNTMDDNARQLAVSIDRHFQEWADLAVKATKEGAEIPPHPQYDEILMMARNIIMPEQMPQQQMQQEEQGTM